MDCDLKEKQLTVYFLLKLGIGIFEIIYPIN